MKFTTFFGKDDSVTTTKNAEAKESETMKKENENQTESKTINKIDLGFGVLTGIGAVKIVNSIARSCMKSSGPISLLGVAAFAITSFCVAGGEAYNLSKVVREAFEKGEESVYENVDDEGIEF